MGLGLIFGGTRVAAGPLGRDESMERVGDLAVSSQVTGVGTEDGSTGEFGANEWLVDELYEQFVHDKNSVDRSWWPILEHYHPSVKEEGAAGAGAPSAKTTRTSVSKLARNSFPP